MSSQVVTVVRARVAEDREAELVQGFRDLVAGEALPGLLRTELLRGQDGTWCVQTLWESREAVVALRQQGRPPAALELLRRLGATPEHDVLTVEHAFQP